MLLSPDLSLSARFLLRVAASAAVGKLEIACVVAAIVAIVLIVLFTDLTKTPVKLTKAELQREAYQKVLAKVSRHVTSAARVPTPVSARIFGPEHSCCS